MLIGRFVDLTNFYVTCIASLLCFVAMMAVGWTSFRFIETPFLRFRVKYVLPDLPAASR
jgi:peptidoglycan/LPS O-acetylase OafA/YrhL